MDRDKALSNWKPTPDHSRRWAAPTPIVNAPFQGTSKLQGVSIIAYLSATLLGSAGTGREALWGQRLLLVLRFTWLAGHR